MPSAAALAVEQGHVVSTPATGHKHNTRDPKTEKTVRMMRERGMKVKDIAAKLRLSLQSATYYSAKAKRESATDKTPHYNSKFGAKVPKIYALKAKGLGLSEIADKLKMAKGSVSYYFYKQPKGEEHTNGNSSLSTPICIGIAYAETERFIAHLSERLAVPAKVLRPRLSELLGRAPLR